MVGNRLYNHSEVISEFDIVKILAYGVPIVAVTVIILGLVFLLKANNLGKLITLASLPKSSRAAPIGNTTREIIDITTDSLILLIVVLAQLLCYI